MMAGFGTRENSDIALKEYPIGRMERWPGLCVIIAPDDREHVHAVAEAVEPGKWYLAINCVYCGEAIPFAPAPEAGFNLYPRHQAVADLKCPLCTHVGTYQPSLIYRYQAPQKRRR